ncbi:MAG TPA: hypothetical protein VLX61_08315 [Anaerolineales bacterium]|nr:hypothetical protein [Anaerolineales bacterium]
MNAFTDYLDRLGGNFLVAAMIPSLGLVIACLIVFDPILRVSQSFQIANGIYSLLGISLVVAVPTIIIGFTLTALNTFVLKLFEGYVFFHHFPFMRMAHARTAGRLIEQRESIKRDIEGLEQKKSRSREEDLTLSKLKAAYYSISASYDQQYPPSNLEVMPTKFGNILKASEAYSGTRYGMDSVQFWPRLWFVIPASYRRSIDEARNELSFLVNMSTLCIVFYSMCLLAIFVSVASFGSLGPMVILENSLRYVLAGFIALALNWFFNRAAIFSVGDFGMMIRSAYDLFRLDLLEQFRLKAPQDSVEEFAIWKNIGELLVLGQESIEFKPLKYVQKRPDSKQDIDKAS